MIKPIILIVLLSAALAPPSKSQTLPSLQGTWLSEEMKFTIAGSGDNLNIHGWGKCGGTGWCDWDTVSLSLVGPSVTSRSYTHALAVWEKGFVTLYVVFKFDSGNLTVEAFSIFHDQSMRSNYRHFAILKKVG